MGERDRRRVTLPLWAVIAAAGLVVVGIVVVVAVISKRSGDPDSAAVRAAVSSVLAATTTTSTTTSTTTTSTTTTTSPPTPPPLPPHPHGSLAYNTGEAFGWQGCLDRPYGFLNNSDTEIVSVTVTPASGSYSGKWNAPANEAYPTIEAETPAPVRLDVSLPAHGARQVFNLHICSATPDPGYEHYYDLDVRLASVSFKWATGYEGQASYG